MGRPNMLHTKHHQKHVFRSAWWMICLCLLSIAAPTAWAQVDQGTITGVVQYSSNAVVPSAAITLTNTDTGLVLQGKANGSGVFVFSPLKIGNYQVSATAEG